MYLNMGSFRFHKSERLCSKVLIDNLFTKGNRVVTQFPFRVLWQFVPEQSFEFPAQMLVSVSKRNFSNATDRNRIKRQIRELYRLNKHTLYDALEQSGKKMTIAFVYQGKTLLSAAQMNESFTKLVQKINHQLEQAA